MSWVKTNFMWMMYRCGWCTKKNQERVLAVRITREGFDKILSKAVSSDADKGLKLRMRGKVRLQWDPDHAPSGAPEKRRAIQLGLRAEVTEHACLSHPLACKLEGEIEMLTLKYCYTLVLAKFTEYSVYICNILGDNAW